VARAAAAAPAAAAAAAAPEPAAANLVTASGVVRAAEAIMATGWVASAAAGMGVAADKAGALGGGGEYVLQLYIYLLLHLPPQLHLGRLGDRGAEHSLER